MNTVCSKCGTDMAHSTFAKTGGLCTPCAREVARNIDEFIAENAEEIENNNILIVDEYNFVKKDDWINFRGRSYISGLVDELSGKNMIIIVYSRSIAHNGPLKSSIPLEEMEIKSKLKLNSGNPKVDYVIPDFWIHSMLHEESEGETEEGGEIGDIEKSLFLFGFYLAKNNKIHRDIFIYATDLSFEEEKGFGFDEDHCSIKLFTANAPKIWHGQSISIRERFGRGMYEEYHKEFDALEALKKFLKNKNALHVRLQSTAILFDSGVNTYKSTSVEEMTEADYMWLTECNTHAVSDRFLEF